jgi:rRNA maturation endonuclease Nob1
MGRIRQEVVYPFIDLGRFGKKFRVKCSLCKRQFEKFRMPTHICKRVDNKELYKNLSENKCNLCDITFSTISNAQKHLRNRNCKSMKPSSEMNTIAYNTQENISDDDGDDQKPKSTEHSIELLPPTPRVFIVVDTNVFIGHLETIDELLAMGKCTNAQYKFKLFIFFLLIYL